MDVNVTGEYQGMMLGRSAYKAVFDLRNDAEDTVAHLIDQMPLQADQHLVLIAELLPESAEVKPDPFARVLLMSRICELEEYARRHEEIRAAMAGHTATITTELAKAASTVGRILALGVEDIDQLLATAAQWARSGGTAAQWPEGGEAAAALKAVAALAPARDALMLAVKTLVANRAAGVQTKA